MLLNMLTGALVAVCCGLLYYLYSDRKRQQRIFKSLGIPGPEPHWWYGNMHQLKAKPNHVHIQMQKWTQEYGKIFGYFEGPTPVLCVSDLDFLQHVFVKKFASFSGRKMFSIQPDPDKGTDGVHIINARGERWKRLRLIVNPTFSSAKLKQLTPLMNAKTDILMDNIRLAAEKESAVDIQKLYQGLTFDVIAEAAFGMDINSQKNSDDPILNGCRHVFEQAGNPGFMVTIPLYMPFLRHQMYWLVRKLAKLRPLPSISMINRMKEIMEVRRQDPSLRRQDLLQMLLDSEIKSDSSKLEISTENDEDAPETDVKVEKISMPKSQRTLSPDEIKMQAFIFILAGYETTSTTLSFASHLLAVNPDKQAKLFEEIDANLGDDEHVSYTKLQSLPYLDMVLRETLRLYPLGTLVINRRCSESCTINGIHIPAGMNIQADVFSIHNDPDIYGPIDPKEFEPERFTAERRASLHPMAWLPFGAGPRNCVGLRFGMMEFKIALARVIKKYELSVCEETQVPLQVAEKAVITPRNGVKLLVKARQ